MTMEAVISDDGETVTTFDLDEADVLASTRRHDGSDWDNRWVRLLRTAKGSYITEHDSLWQNESTFYRLASPDEAARFLARWRRPDDPEVPSDLRPLLEALEI
jgi:hypothetical protein